MAKQKPDYKARYRLANKQRLAALKNAFKTIDHFASPSLDPEQSEQYEKIRKILINRYSQP